MVGVCHRRPAAVEGHARARSGPFLGWPDGRPAHGRGMGRASSAAAASSTPTRPADARRMVAGTDAVPQPARPRDRDEHPPRHRGPARDRHDSGAPERAVRRARQRHELDLLRDARRAGRARGRLRRARLLLLATLAITVLWMIWMYRAAANAEMFSLARQRFGKGFAIGGWFIPFANLVIPGLQMADIWRGSPGPDAPGTPRRSTALVWWWWIIFLVGRVTFFALPGGVRLGRVYRLSDLDTRVTLSVVGYVFVAVSAVLAILVVQRITSGQESGATRLRGPVAIDPFTAMAAASVSPPQPAPTHAYPP